MQRCLHIGSGGSQCSRDAQPDRDLCYLHDDAPVDELTVQATPLRKILFRVAAALLLVIFAVETYHILKALLRGL